MFKLVVIALWAVSFLILNYGSKRLASTIILDGGASRLAMSVVLSPWSYAVVILYGACAMFYMLLLRVMPLSIAGPVLLSLGIVITTAAGALFFKEDVLQARSVIGIILCLAGIALLQGGARG